MVRVLWAAIFLAGLAGCGSGLEGPTPRPAAVAPAIACVEQVTTTVTLRGSGLSPMPTGALTESPELALPRITLVPATGLDGAPRPSTTVTVPDGAGAVRWTSQGEMVFEVSPSLALEPGLYDARVKNPDGREGTLAGALLALPRPAIASIEPDLVCGEQNSGIVLTGDFFLELKDGSRPVVELRSGGALHTYAPVDMTDCRDLPGSSGTRACRELRITVPADDVAAGSFDVVLVNPAPAACASTDPQRLAVVPAPVVAAIDPDLTCVDDGEASFTMTGTGFLAVDGDEPTVLVGDRAYAAQLDRTSCTGVETMHETVLSCTRLAFTVPQSDLPAGVHDVNVRNPAPADCTSEVPRRLSVIGAPRLEAIIPDLVCLAEGDVPLSIEGEGFLVTADAAPTLTIGERSYGTTPDETSCAVLDEVGSGARLCARLQAVLSRDDLPAGLHAPRVTNPAPAACFSKETVGLEVLAPPVVIAVEPLVACDDGVSDVAFAVTGEGFMVIDGESPRVHVGGAVVPATADPSTCVDVPGLATPAQRCTRLTATLATGAVPPGDHAVIVENPAPAACSSSDAASLRITGVPRIDSVVPARICAGGGTLVVSGGGFETFSTASLGGVPGRVDAATPAQLSARFSEGLLVGGPYDLTIHNAPGCSDTAPGVVTVVPGPQIFFADPPVVYSGISTQVQLYVTGVTDTVQSVSIRPSGTADPLTVLVSTWSPARPNRVQVVVPSGTPAGSYDVYLSDATECEATLLGNLTVTDTLTVSLTSIDPPFGWTDGHTGVTLGGEDPTPDGQVGFSGLPRFYLSPEDAGAGTTATALSSVQVLGAARATAVVPSGLPVGTYDLIAVNADGSVGLLESAFDVTADPPPTIDTITPGSLANSASETFEVLGSDLRSPSVSLACRNDGGTSTDIEATTSAPSATSVTATFDASVLADGALCVVRVTNDDGTYGDFSALTVTSPSQNLGAPVRGTSLTEARRAPTVLAGSVTRAARFVYAMGGDGGSTDSAISTVESAPVDVYGVPGAFSRQRYELPGARTLAGGARVERFLYLAGGDDGAGPVDSVIRAYILDPADRMEIADLLIGVGGGTLVPGVYSYRIAPVMAEDDPFNPGGENLPSEPFPVVLPDLDTGFSVELSWTEVPGADLYRVYRSPAADDPAGSERLLAEVPAGSASWVDDGSATTTDEAPMALGSTGIWHEVATLAAARAGAGVVSMAMPADRAVRHLHVMGGLGTGGTLLRSIETIEITVNADGSQDVAAPVTSQRNLTAARWQMALMPATHDVSSRIVEGEAWIYAAGGSTSAAGGSATGVVDAFPVAPDGALGAPVAVNSMSPTRAGFGGVAVNNFLHVFGGSSGMASNAVASAENCGVGRACKGIEAPPDLVNWNSAGVSLVDARVLMGTAVQSGVIYIVGGHDGTAALSSTEHTHW